VTIGHFQIIFFSFFFLFFCFFAKLLQSIIERETIKLEINYQLEEKLERGAGTSNDYLSKKTKSNYLEIIQKMFTANHFVKRFIKMKLTELKLTSTSSGCGVAHAVVHTTPVQEDLGSILYPNPGWHFRKLSSPFFQTTDLKMIFFNM
jgi:hypothetical protein